MTTPSAPGATRRRTVLLSVAVLMAVGAVVLSRWAGDGVRGPDDAKPVARPTPSPAQPRPAPPAPVAAATAVVAAVAAVADAGPEQLPAEPVRSAEVVLPLNASPERRRLAATQLRTRAASLFKQKAFKVALPLYELSVRLDPESPEGAERLGATLARTGDATRAVYYYSRFLELAPDDPLALDLKDDVGAWLKDNPNPALEMMRIGAMRPLSQAEADLQGELARRLTNTSDPEADLTWFLGELSRLGAPP